MNPKFDKNKFFKRFMNILSTRTNAWWIEKLNIAPSLIPARWKKGHLPSLHHFIDICETDGISSDWFLFGIGKQNLSERRTDFDYEEKDNAYERILRLKSTNKKLQKENQKLKGILNEMFKVYVSTPEGKALLDIVNDENK